MNQAKEKSHFWQHDANKILIALVTAFSLIALVFGVMFFLIYQDQGTLNWNPARSEVKYIYIYDADFSGVYAITTYAASNASGYSFWAVVAVLTIIFSLVFYLRRMDRRLERKRNEPQ